MGVRAIVAEWQGETDAKVTGAIQFSNTQVPQVTALNVNLNGLSSEAGTYHVHEVSLSSTSQGVEICDTALGHFNPFSKMLNFCSLF